MFKDSLVDMNKHSRTPSTINKIHQLISDIIELNPAMNDFDSWDIILIAVDSMKRDLKECEQCH